MTPNAFCSEKQINPDLPYSGIIRVGVVDHQLAAGPGAADGDPRVVIAWLGVCSTDAALSVHIVTWGVRVKHSRPVTQTEDPDVADASSLLP